MMGKNSAQAIRKAPVEAEIRGEKVKMDKKAVNMDNVIIYQRIESLMIERGRFLLFQWLNE